VLKVYPLYFKDKEAPNTFQYITDYKTKIMQIVMIFFRPQGTTALLVTFPSALKPQV
jgi:hypothetical protein